MRNHKIKKSFNYENAILMKYQVNTSILQYILYLKNVKNETELTRISKLMKLL